jgi:2-oxoglutarate/2-oxoacid ferredoxin oxidoreductase subunit beta
MPEKTPHELNTSYSPTWCPGCGNFGLWGALKKALTEINIPREQIFAVYGIGCSGNGFNFTDINAFHGLHGRPLPVAEGVKLANHKLTVIALGGDGDGYGEGGNHFLHACRANHDLAYFVHDNQIYGLTTGQTSPTSELGQKSRSNPSGSVDRPVNPVALALAAGATFVARGFTGDINHLAELMKAAIQHRGFGFVDILQPCFTFNKYNTYQYFRQRIYKLEQHDKHDKADISKAMTLAWQWEHEDKIPLGIFYQNETIPAFHEHLPQLEGGPAAERALETDIRTALKEYI